MKKQRIIWTLAAANVALAGTLAWRGIPASAARAQAATPGAPARVMEQGKYVMIPGASNIGVSIVYVLDTRNRRIGGFAPNARNTLDTMPTLALDPVFEAAAVGAGGPLVNPDSQRSPIRGGGLPRDR